MGDDLPEIEVYPHWLRANEESREKVLQSLERNEWRAEIERNRPEPSLADEKLWCDEDLFERLVEMKKVLSGYKASEFESVRRKWNPHEPLLENKVMIGRYSLLLASIDRVTDFLLTQENIEDAVTKRPLDTRPRGKNVDREADIFYFAESQTLPLPFASQYIWLRKGFYNAKCFSPQLSPTSPLSPLVSHSFLDTLRRVAHKSKDDLVESCNPYESAVREAFTDLILRGTHGEGVHLYAGFTHNISPYKEKYGEESANTNETPSMVSDAVKEVLFRDSYVSQLLFATRVVRKGGRAILHFLDTNTSLSMAVVYLAHIVFDRVSIYKPNMSRPANSERFLICDGLRSREAKAVKKYIEESIERVRKGESLTRLFSDGVMEEDSNFIDYARDANNQLAEHQYEFLSSYRRMLNGEQSDDNHQNECLETCLPYYLIPYATQDEMKNFHHEMKNRTGMDILNSWIPDGITVANLFRSLSSNSTKMDQQLFKEKMESSDSLLFTPCSDSSAILIVATNYGIEFWSGKCKEWIGLSRITTILPTDSVLIGDIIEVPDGRTLILRILDAGIIFGDNISSLPFKKRLQAAEKLVEATRKDGARQDVVLSVAQYEEMDVGWRPTLIGDQVVENEIYFKKNRIRIVEESNISFFNRIYGEKVWEI